jgi:hypothetical protein
VYLVWVLTGQDIFIAKARVMERRRALEEQLIEIEAELAELEAIQQCASAFLSKYPANGGKSRNPDEGNDSIDPEPNLIKTALLVPSQPQEQATNWGSSQLVTVPENSR